MDLTTIIYFGSKIMLFMVMIFGAFLAFKNMNKGKLRTLFSGYLLFWALLLFFDVYSIIGSFIAQGNTDPYTPPLLALVTAITSQLVILWFYYNLLFTLKKSTKIIAAHLVIVAIMLVLIKCFNNVEVGKFFSLADTLELVYKGISTQSIFFKALIVVMQLSFSIIALFASYKLVPIYQKYIEQNESNTAYNILWIKEVSRILFLVTFSYVYLMIFTTYTNAIIYYFILIVAYMRMISILIQHVTLDNFDELYDKLGVKWNWQKMWYIEESVSPEISEVKSQFNTIIEWIQNDRPYINPHFSFKDITIHFEGVTYNDFDSLIKLDKGLNFQAYIRECRIDYATELMDKVGNTLLLKEIAFKVGFDSSTAFSRAFKATKGIAASEWRAKK